MGRIPGVRRYLRLPWRSASRVGEELDEELTFHLEMREEELRASGLARSAARAEALRRFGNVDDARRYLAEMGTRGERRARRASLVAELAQDLKTAFRQLSAHAGFSVATVLTLGLGIAVSTTVYGLVDAYVLRPLPFPQAERLVSVIAAPSREPFPNMPRLGDVDWRLVDPIFEETVAWDLDGFTLVGGDRPEYADGAWVSQGYFTVHDIRPALGRGFTPDEYLPGSQVALISHALWMRRYGGDRAILGRSVRAFSTDRPREEQLVTIVGVMRADQWLPGRFTEVLRPLTTPRMLSLARLRPGMTMAEAERRLNAVVRAQLPGADPAWKMTLVSAHDEYVHELRPTLVALLAGALLLFFMACVNVAGLLVARGISRRAELGIRAALGAGRGRLVRQLLTEHVVLFLLAGFAGLAAGTLALGALGELTEARFGLRVPGGPAQLVLATPAALGLLGASVVIMLLVALRPVLVASRTDAVTLLRSGARGSTFGARDARVRGVLIASQVAVAFALLVGAGLMARTVRDMATVELGFRPEGLVRGSVLLPLARYADDDARRRVVAQAMNTLRSQPGIGGAAVVMPPPFRGLAPGALTVEGRPVAAGSEPRATHHTVTPTYFDVLGITLRGGRLFTGRDDATAVPAVIVSERLARQLWPDGGALGKRISLGDAQAEPVWRTVVGIVGDVRKTITGEQLPDTYVPYEQNPRAYVYVVARGAGEPAAVASRVRRALGSVDEVLALSDVQSLPESVARESARQRLLTTLLGGFSVFALVLAAIGLYGTLAYVVAERRREIAIRMAVGAKRGDVVGLVARGGAKVIAAGIFVGLNLGAALGRVLESQLYGVTVSDPVTYVTIASVITVVALCAMVVPAKRAAGVDPAEVLRGE